MTKKITQSKKRNLHFKITSTLTILLMCFSVVAFASSPVVTSTTPSHNATNVNVTDLITVTFDQPIQAGLSGKLLTIWYADTESIYNSYTTSSLSISGNTLTLNTTLPYNTNFYISLENGLVKNASDQYNATYGFSSGWAFTTEIDSYNPILQAMSPSDGLVGVYEGTNLLSYTFDENVQAGSGNILVKRVDNNSTTLSIDIANPSNVSVSGNTLTIIPTTGLDYSTEYYVEFPSGVIEDLLGNPFAGIGAPPLADQNFTMRDAPADTFPPAVSSFSPSDNATGVDVNTDFTINFNENVQIGTGSIFVKISSNGNTIYEIDASDVSITGSTVTFTLPDNLFRLTNYFITIDPTAFADLAGNGYPGISNNLTWNFTTATASDITPPTAITLTPSDNATDVSITDNLTLLFSEAVQLTENAVLKNFGGAVIPSTSTISESTLTINPTSNLTFSTSYYVEIAYGAIRDLGGNSFAEISGNTTWNFTTEAAPDTTPPVAVTYTPADNATDISIATNLTLTFDETIQLTGSAVLKNFSGAIIPSTSTASGSTLTINPTADLVNSTQYYVEIASGVVQDVDSNNFAGFTGNTTWNFTTEVAPDTTPPTIVSLSPADNSTDASVSNNLVLTFSEDVVKTGFGIIEVYNFNTGDVIPSTNTLSGNILTINPTSNLSYSTPYYVKVFANAIEDLNQNDFAGATNNSTWNFTTEEAPDTTPPNIVAFVPADDATGVDITTDLTVTFNEDIQLIGSALLKEYSTENVIPSTSRVSGSVLTINPTSDLLNNTHYYVEIAIGVVQDVASNNFAGTTNKRTWDFTTIAAVDTTPPSVVNFVPVSKSSGISISTNLTATFNEAIQLTGSAVLKDFATNNVIPSTSSVSGSVLTINPTANLANNTLYFVEIASGVVQDLSSNNFAGFTSNGTWNFTTEAASDTTPPTTVTFTPVDNATGVNIASSLTLVFSETIQLTGSAVLKDFSGAVIPSTSTASVDRLIINPTADLVNSTQYYVEIASGVVQDLASNNFTGFTGNSTWNFTTEATVDTTLPLAMTFSPIDNATGVSTTNDLTITFDEAIQIAVSGASKRALIKRDDGSIFEVVNFTSGNFSGNTLTIPHANFENNQLYYITINNGVVADLAGNWFAGFTDNTTWNFTTEEDTTSPTITNVTSSQADGSYGIGTTINITVVFSENVIVTGTPQLALETGSSDAVVDYISGSNSTELLFSYEVLSGHVTLNLDYISTTALTLNSGTIKDAADNNAILTLATPGATNSLGFNTNIEINTTVLGIDDEILKTLQMYPNPCSTKELKLKIPNSIQEAFISITNSMGQEVYSEEIRNNYNSAQVIDTNRFKAGLYFVIVQTENGKTTKKLLIN